MNSNFITVINLKPIFNKSICLIIKIDVYISKSPHGYKGQTCSKLQR